MCTAPAGREAAGCYIAGDPFAPPGNRGAQGGSDGEESACMVGVQEGGGLVGVRMLCGMSSNPAWTRAVMEMTLNGSHTLYPEPRALSQPCLGVEVAGASCPGLAGHLQ